MKYSELITRGAMGYVSLSYEQATGTTAPSLADDDYIPLTFNTERAENLDGYSLSGSQQITLPRGTYIGYMLLGSYSTNQFSGGLAVVGTGDPSSALFYGSSAIEEGYVTSGAQTIHVAHFRLTEETIIEAFICARESGTMTRTVNATGLVEIRYTLTLVKVL